jgi:hypothetical protein
MFRKQVNPKFAAIVTLVTLAGVQWFYWRNLVYQRSGGPLRGAGGGPLPPQIPVTLGSEQVIVENWVGDEAGYRDGAAWEARFSGPNALAMARDGALLVADSRNHCLRAISPIGRVSTLAGGGSETQGGSALGPASLARFRFPSGVAAMPDGSVIIADTGNHRLCRLKEGAVSLFTGGTRGMADGAGPAARFDSPGPMSVDKSGRIWVLDAGNQRLRAVTASGSASTPSAVPSEVQQTLGLVLSMQTQTVWGSLDGRTTPVASEHRTGRCGTAGLLPSGGRAYGDVSKHVLYFQASGSEPILIAGRLTTALTVIGDVPNNGARASFASPAAVLAGPQDILYVADYDNNRIRRVRLAGSPYR